MLRFVTFSANARFVFLLIVWTHPDPKWGFLLQGSLRLSHSHSGIMQRRSLGPQAAAKRISWVDRAPCHFSWGVSLSAASATGQGISAHMLCVRISKRRRPGKHPRRCIKQMADVKAFGECAGLSKLPLPWIFSILNSAPRVCTGCEIKCWMLPSTSASHLDHGEC